MNAPPSKKRALLVLGMTEATLRAGGKGELVPAAETALPFIQGELKYFRERGRPVFFVLPEDAVVIRELTPRPGERTLHPSAPSAFFATELGEALAEENVGRVTIVGHGAATGVLLTAADAMARGFGVTVPEPCLCGDDEERKIALKLVQEIWPKAHASADAS